MKAGQKGRSKWGKLVSRSDRVGDLELYNDTTTIGRKHYNDIRIEDKRISATHCRVVRDGSSDKAKYSVEDMSVNGTYYNGKKIGKGGKRELKDGDEVFLLITPKVAPPEAIGFRFSLTSATDHVPKRPHPPQSEEREHSGEKRGKKEEDPTCTICTKLYYQPVTALPCMHTFCGACLTQSVTSSTDCPVCTNEIREVRQNSSMNSVVKECMDKTPEKRRTEEECKHMQEQNVFTADLMQVNRIKRKKRDKPRREPQGDAKRASNVDTNDTREEKKGSVAEEEKKQESKGRGDEPEKGSKDSEAEEEKKQPSRSQANESEKKIKMKVSRAAAAQKKGRRPNDSDLDSEEEEGPEEGPEEGSEEGPEEKKQSTKFNSRTEDCKFCKKKKAVVISDSPKKSRGAKCFICSKGACESCCSNGKLVEVTQHPITEDGLGIFSRNDAEGKILKDYLKSTKLSFHDVLVSALSNPSQCTLRGKTLTASTRICGDCFQEFWNDVLDDYREGIRALLPKDARDRPDCWYGRECRTQFHNKEHAKKYNHICNNKRRHPQ